MSAQPDQVVTHATSLWTSKILAKHTGQTYETVERDVERDRIMSAEQAKEYGLIDEVLANREQAKDEGGRQAHQ